ncbi:hypothetical protein MOMA_05135 [Moraxella macacae 0408225]|uniref:Uncharacterized protein n=2 Tax=Moraxella macacae TaxID=765840 RepID=L2F9K8_9GAMM|nr:hypothetical protein MOMA_05135 [Moraxella macacae 0408225]
MTDREPSAFLPDLKTFLLAISPVILVWLPVLLLHLTLVLFAGLITYTFTRAIANSIRQSKQMPTFFGKFHANNRAEMVAIAVIVALISLATYLFGDWMMAKANVMVLNRLLEQLMSIIEQLHTLLPFSISQYLPISDYEFKEMLLRTAKQHAPQLQTLGVHTLRGVGYFVIGIAIGAIMALQIPSTLPLTAKPFLHHMRQRFDELITGFSDVFFAQVKISSINTILTSVYLLGILPMIGHPLPMSWTVVLITFLAGLIPVVGNLFSNVVIVTLSLTHGLMVSVLSLTWLVAIHKLEYFLNAQIIGTKIRATAWELLLFMLVLEATFGLAGLISAPVIYAQIKRILHNRGWV